MDIHFSPIEEGFIKHMIERGFYGNETELVQDAVKRLREQESTMQTPLMAALARGEADIAAGRAIPYTADFLNECEELAHQLIARGEKPNPDVCA